MATKRTWTLEDLKEQQAALIDPSSDYDTDLIVTMLDELARRITQQRQLSTNQREKTKRLLALGRSYEKEMAAADATAREE